MTVNVDAIEKWATRLESGKDKQVSGVLYNGTGFCCLGVLCDIAVEEGVIEPVKESKWTSEPCDCGACEAISYTTTEYYYNGSGGTLPAEVAEWAFGDSGEINPDLKLHEPIEDVYGGGSVTHDAATSLNDCWHWDFPKIGAAVRHTFLSEANDGTVR